MRVLAACALAGAAGIAQGTPEQAARYYEDALKRFERDDLGEAIIQLKNAIKEDQRLLAAHLLLGKAMLRKGEFKGAEAAFEEALKQGVDRSEVAVPLARLYISLGRPEMVIDKIPASGLPRPIQLEVLGLRGTAYFELGNPRAAARAFDEARALDPASATPYIAEVPTLLLQGFKDRAKASAALAIQLAPASSAAWNMQASVLHDALDVGGALAGYNKAIDLDARNVEARIARAGLLIDLKRDADAQKDLDFLVDAAREDPRAAYLRAQLATKKGDTANTVKWLTEAAHVIDTLPSEWLQRREQLMMLGALSNHGLGNFQKARDFLARIVTRNPNNVAARKLLVSIYVQTRDYSRAMPLLEVLQKTYPDDPQVLFQLGNVYVGQKRYALAVQMLQRALAKSDTPEINRALAFGQIGLGQEDAGQATLEKVFAANQGDFEAGMALAMLQVRRGQQKKGIQTAEAMFKHDRSNLSIHNFLGTVKAASGDQVGARAIFEQVQARAPGYRPATLNLIKLDVAEGKFDNGRQRAMSILAKQAEDLDTLYELGVLERSAGRPDDAMRHFRKAADSPRKDNRAGLAIVDILIGQKKPAEAITAAKELDAKYPESLGVQLALGRSYLAAGETGKASGLFKSATRTAEFDADMQVMIGRLQLAAGNLEGAAYNVQKALQGRPDDVGAMLLALDLEIARKDQVRADASLKALATKHPNRVETFVATATLAMSRAQYPAAIAAYRSALAREQDQGIALGLASALIATGEAGKAVAFLEGWAKTRPADREALKALAEAQFRAGQLPAARVTYTKALGLEPDNALMLNNFAILLQQLGDPTAVQVAQKALRVDPGNPQYADSLGWIMVQNDQVEGGLRYLREARLRSPDDPEIRYHLAFALARIGRKAEAKDELLVALASPTGLRSREDANRLKKELGI